MPDVSVEIKGLEQLERKIGGLATLKVVHSSLKAGVLHVRRHIAVYPQSSEANKPFSRRWYERGYGPKWMTKSGDVHGRKTSETLGRKWTIARPEPLTWIVGNNVSYGPYVQGEKQAHFHEVRGWKTTETVAKEQEATVLKFVQQEINKALAKK